METELESIRNMSNDFNVYAIFADSDPLSCCISFDLEKDCIYMTINNHKRLIQLKDIKEIVGLDNDSLMPLELDLDLLSNPLILAFRLCNSKKIIVLLFSCIEKRQAFANFITNVITENSKRNELASLKH
ncbi:bifunctional ISP3 [Babesia duncani]|uniref:Bifunctional ISP3 n=1 Tax=Babesia duncani TaxID=323732 RepID=A0AAD9UMR0_9APIC|nr:bifunctional ISP3 [Babesia duncani]